VNAGDHNGQENEHQRAQFGAVLERRRREKGLSLRDVEQATKIRTRYLEGLEREDYSVLPDAVYVQGFLKTYANFLGLDGERLSRDLRDRRAPRRERPPGVNEDFGGSDFEQPFEQPLITPGALRDAERRRISGATLLTVALAVVVLAATIGALYLIGSRYAEVAQREEPPAEPGSSPSPRETGPEQAAGGEGTTAQIPADTVRATVRVVGGSSGLTISADGTVVEDRMAQSGFSQTFEAQRSLRVEAADGGNVEVEVDGQNLGRLASSGQPVTRDFTPQSPEGTTPEGTTPEATGPETTTGAPS
jgi:cytoskeleton protein RodZ